MPVPYGAPLAPVDMVVDQATSDGVSVVGLGGPAVDVAWSATPLDVAVMANIHPVCDRPVDHLVDNAMNVVGFPIHVDRPVAVGVPTHGTSPQPAGVLVVHDDHPFPDPLEQRGLAPSCS